MNIIFSLLTFSYLALLIHGNVPIHYYVTVAPFALIVVAYAITKLKISNYIILFLIILLNLNFYFSDKWLYKKGDYLKQKQIAQEIAIKAGGREFNLKRVGPFDYYDYNYAQNYRYLLWILGNEPVDEKKDLLFTIYEQNNNIYFK